MSKGTGEIANSNKTEGLPKPNCALVCTYNQIELHRSESPGFGEFDRMLAHRTGKPATSDIRGNDVSTVGNVRAASELVGSEIISTDHPSVIFRYKSLAIGADPVRDRLCLRHFARQRVGFSGANDRLDNAPYCRGVARPCRSYYKIRRLFHCMRESIRAS